MKPFVAFTLTIFIGAVLSGCTTANQANSESAQTSVGTAGTTGNVAPPAPANGAYPGQAASGAPKQSSGSQTAQPNRPITGNPDLAAAVETVVGSGVVVNAPQLAELSIEQIDKTLGAPRGQQNLGSGVKRIYSLDGGKAELEVSVQPDKKISALVLKLNEPRKSSEDLLRAAGLDAKGRKPNWETEIVKKYENQDFGGTRFKQVSTSMNPAEQLWDRIELRIAN